MELGNELCRVFRLNNLIQKNGTSGLGWLTVSGMRLSCIDRRQAMFSDVKDSIVWNLVQITYCSSSGRH